MQRKQADPKKYVLVFILTTIIFLAGLIIGYFLSSQKLSDVHSLQEGLRTDTLDIELQYDLLEQDPCSFTNTTLLSDDLYDIAVRLDYMEGQLGADDADVLRLKRYYSLLQIKQWLFEKQLTVECDTGRHLILYFYSNMPGECPQCEEQGFILSYLRKKYGSSLAVYSFDTNLDSNSVAALLTRFEIDGVPTLVIDGESYTGFRSTAELEEIMFPPPDEAETIISEVNGEMDATAEDPGKDSQEALQ